MLVAVHVLLSRILSVNAWNIKIGLAFLPVYAAAYLYGPWVAALVGGIGDLVGALAFPIGPYFPGFTLSCALTGVIFGLLLKGGKPFKSVVLAAAADQVIVGLLMNTFWISLLYGSPFLQLMEIRSIQAAIMFVLETVVIRLMDVPMTGDGRHQIDGCPDEESCRILL